MAENPELHLPAISQSVGKKLSMAQASKLHSHPERTSPLSSVTSSPRINGSTQSKLLLHMPHLQSDNTELSPTQSPRTHRRIQALLSPSVSRKKLLKNVDWRKSQSTSNLYIPRELAVEFKSNLDRNVSKSHSTPRLLHRDLVLTSRTSSPTSHGSGSHPKSGSSDHVTITSNRRQKSDISIHKTWKSREKINAERTLIDYQSRLHNHEDARLSDDHTHTSERNRNHNTHQASSNAHGQSTDNRVVNESELIWEESPEYAKQLFNKCQNWLAGVEEAKEHHSLEKVIEPPVTWAD